MKKKIKRKPAKKKFKKRLSKKSKTVSEDPFKNIKKEFEKLKISIQKFFTAKALEASYSTTRKSNKYRILNKKIIKSKKRIKRKKRIKKKSLKR